MGFDQNSMHSNWYPKSQLWQYIDPRGNSHKIEGALLLELLPDTNLNIKASITNKSRQCRRRRSNRTRGRGWAILHIRTGVWRGLTFMTWVGMVMVCRPLQTFRTFLFFLMVSTWDWLLVAKVRRDITYSFIYGLGKSRVINIHPFYCSFWQKQKVQKWNH